MQKSCISLIFGDGMPFRPRLAQTYDGGMQTQLSAWVFVIGVPLQNVKSFRIRNETTFHSLFSSYGVRERQRIGGL